MPPRYSYWTIIAGGLPTAFRAYERDELMPTFTRLREKQPDAELKWFARGKLWESPDAARADTEKRRGGFAREESRPSRAPRGEGSRDGARAQSPVTPDRARHRDRPGGPPRNREWRPGGEHRDPRQKYKDAKKAKNLDRRREKFARKQAAGDRFRAPGAPPDAAPGPSKRFRPEHREGGPAAPKRFKPEHREGGKRDEFRAREERDGRDRPPRRDEVRRSFDADRTGSPRPDWRNKPTGTSAPKRFQPEHRGGGPAAPKRFQPDHREGGPAAPKRFKPEHREGGKREWDRPRDGRDRPPRGDETRPAFDRNRPGPARQDWRNQAASPPRAPKRDWNRPRDGGSREKPQSDKFRPRGRDEYRPRDEYRSRDERDRPAGPPRRDDRLSSDRNRTSPKRPDWRNKPAGPPAARKRERDRPRDSGAVPPKREWDRPRDGGPVPPKREGDRARDGRPVPPKREWERAREGGRPFQRKGFERNQGTEEPTEPPKPRGPNREPRPSEIPEPGSPPRPTEPAVPPPGPPERGRLVKPKRRP